MPPTLTELNLVHSACPSNVLRGRCRSPARQDMLYPELRFACARRSRVTLRPAASRAPHCSQSMMICGFRRLPAILTDRMSTTSAVGLQRRPVRVREPSGALLSVSRRGSVTSELSGEGRKSADTSRNRRPAEETVFAAYSAARLSDAQRSLFAPDENAPQGRTALQATAANALTLTSPAFPERPPPAASARTVSAGSRIWRRPAGCARRHLPHSRRRR